MSTLKPVLYIGSSYRKQLFEAFIRNKTLGDGPTLYLDSSRFLRFPEVIKNAFSKVLQLSQAIAVSDAEGGALIQSLNLLPSQRVYWFCWNAVDDIADWDLSLAKSNPNIVLCFLFNEEALKAKQKYNISTVHLKNPVILAAKQPGDYQHKITYLAEVETAESLKTEKPELDKMLWLLADRFTHQEAYFRDPKMIAAFQSQFPGESLDYLIWLLRNRVRFLYARQLKEKFGNGFHLVGNDWEKTGLKSAHTNYDPSIRKQLYRQSRICLDLLSKSSLEAQYPRSAELVSFSNGIFQLQSVDGSTFFGPQTQRRTFKTVEELENKIEQFLALSDQEQTKLGSELRTFVAGETRAYNEKQLSKLKI